MAENKNKYIFCVDSHTAQPYRYVSSMDVDDGVMRLEKAIELCSQSYDPSSCRMQRDD